MRIQRIIVVAVGTSFMMLCVAGLASAGHFYGSSGSNDPPIDVINGTLFGNGTIAGTLAAGLPQPNENFDHVVFFANAGDSITVDTNGSTADSGLAILEDTTKDGIFVGDAPPNVGTELTFLFSNDSGGGGSDNSLINFSATYTGAYLASIAEQSGGEMEWFVNVSGSTFVPPIEIALDIKPGPSNNTVALNGNGTLRMAILANEEFNVMDINIGSLLFGDPILVDGGATPLGATSDRLRDLNHDGLDDLLVGFSISDLVAGGALDASSVEGRLTGELLDGTPIVGSDIVRMVPQNNGGALVTSAVPEPSTCTLALVALCLAMGRRRAF